MIAFKRLLATVCVLLLSGCGVDSGPTTSNTVNDFSYSVSVTPQLTSLAASATQIFTAKTAAPDTDLTWTIPPSNNAGGAGSPETQTGGYTFTYTAPAFPPLYTPGSATQQGTVTLTTTTGSGGNTESTTQTFVITTPNVIVGFFTQPTIVPLNTSITIFAYALGNTNQGLSMEVNGIAGGNSTVGTIVPYTGAGASYGEYVYTAPASYPPNVSGTGTTTTITITAVSAFDKTETATLILTLQ